MPPATYWSLRIVVIRLSAAITEGWSKRSFPANSCLYLAGPPVRM